ncbi:hypothetical protein PVK06_048667 [Gossypium arboreum]|uniref:Uncharacterized protein n=1 Tax=Gossypium arboreum TaxID=29729 RepID=A0ABR0MGH6_GOSAR|nr:hypothetical protein PVK06_048667 [Gossypium arboreum]
MKYTTPARHSVGGWDMHLGGLIPDGAEVGLFSKPEPVPTIPEDVEGGLDEEEEDLRFRAYSPSAHMHNVDLSQNDALEFPDLPHRRCDHTRLSLDSGEIKVGREFSNKDSFLAALNNIAS